MALDILGLIENITLDLGAIPSALEPSHTFYGPPVHKNRDSSNKLGDWIFFFETGVRIGL